MTDSTHLENYARLRDACFKEGYLEDQSKTKEIALAMFRQNWSNGRYMAEDSPFSEDASRMFLQVTQVIIEGNINAIYECSQSPIERMFLCSFLIHSVFLHPWRINITGPIDMNTYPALPKKWRLPKKLAVCPKCLLGGESRRSALLLRGPSQLSQLTRERTNFLGRNPVCPKSTEIQALFGQSLPILTSIAHGITNVNVSMRSIVMSLILK